MIIQPQTTFIMACMLRLNYLAQWVMLSVCQLY